MIRIPAIDRKLLRDLRRIWVQALAIAVLVGCAVATFVGSVATYRALERSQARHYEEHRFADVFCEAPRVPEPVAERIARLPGVAEVETRVVAPATVELPGSAEPVTARVLSLPAGGPRLNLVHLRAGRDLAPGALDEALVSEGFAKARGVAPGDRLDVVVNGRRQAVRLAGVAISPEVVYAIRPGDVFPDDRHFAVLWMPREALAAAMDMEGAFDEASLVLAPGAGEAEVVEGIDRILAPYGGAGAYGRGRHVSHRFLTDEISQLRAMASVMPAIFLGVASFLVSIVLSRMVATQRQQIGMMRAVGYTAAEVGLHYAKLVTVVALAGAALGGPGGIAMGRAFARTYADFYRLPAVVFEGDALVVLLASALALAGALAGSLGAVRAAARLPPAEAMRPAPPPSYRPTLVERLGAARVLSPAARMVLRDLGRRPVRALLSSLGLAFAVAILVVAWFANDALDLMFTNVFGAELQDATVTFTSPLSEDAVVELRRYPGVVRAEPFRAVPATLRSGHRTHRTALTGIDPDAKLSRIVDVDGSIVPLPPEGLVLSAKLAEILGVRPGGEIVAEVLEGRRPVRTLPVAAVVEDFLGVRATAPRAWLAGALGEAPLASGAYLAVDAARAPELQARLREAPRVAGVTMRAATIAAYRELVEGLMLVYLGAVGLLALAIAAGVVYNAARVTWAERERELATLRVVGFTRGEVWRILAGEMAVHLAAAIPAGFAIGLAFVHATAARASTDLYRLPTVIDRATYAGSALTVAAATALVLAVAVRWIRRLDLVEVLKSRE